MKNLIGAVAPTNRVLVSFKFLMLIVLVAIGFTSCKDQSKSEVSQETELIAKADLQGAQSNFDIGGNGGQERRNFDIGGIGGGQTPPRRICEMYSTKEIGGGKNSNGCLEKPSDTGGRGNQGTTGEYAVSDIGGRNTNSTGNYTSNDIGGRGTNTGTGEYSISDIGGGTGGKGTSSDTGQIESPDDFDDLDTGGSKGTNTNTGEYSFADTGGKNSIGGLEKPSDIGGRGGVEPPGVIDLNTELPTNKRFGCIRSPF
jgi:hypothetical protein